jgi:hypothetical protein
MGGKFLKQGLEKGKIQGRLGTIGGKGLKNGLAGRIQERKRTERDSGK